ncbi:hypothetical protein GCM10010251_68650 [Streptomyces aurantiogriseus]|uniref:Uncharacterized protein n=1 Tax=Streptomyces aurantiogriseus TaxID=66870 RepID=A0A918KXU2_9ACTN|nr:hypothetical protein GCM10010251_68650 [Streptomyces aurantiogriseus]
MFWWLAMSALWPWAALESVAFRVTGEQPALLRSLLTRATMRDTAEDAGAAVPVALGDGAEDAGGSAGAVEAGAVAAGEAGAEGCEVGLAPFHRSFWDALAQFFHRAWESSFHRAEDSALSAP